ncbi:MAG: dipeptidase [Treponema sp.]|nr:dipeptidase [Treponema sp.]
MAHKVIDLHCDSIFHIMDGKDLRVSTDGVHVDLPRLKKGRVGLQVFAVYIPPNTEHDKAFLCAAKGLDAVDAFSSSHEDLIHVENAAELKSVLQGEKVGIMSAIENGLAIEDSLDKLKELRQRKVRIMTLVHSQNMSWIESCTGTGDFKVDTGRGLSSFGEKVVDAMNDLGIIPDVSHSSVAAFWDVIKRSKKPIIASHSCALSICGAKRNLNDDQLKALGESGAVVGINFASSFLSEPYRLAYMEARANNPPPASITVSDILTRSPKISVPVPHTIIADHIDYMINIAGEDCLALGSDFDGIPAAPDGVTGSDYYPVLEDELKKRGYSDKRIEKIFYGNFLRVLEAWDK